MKTKNEVLLGVAYHEAAHITVASVLGLAIGSKGVTVTESEALPTTGVAHFEGADSGGAVPAEKVDLVIIALLAGGIAHSHYKQDVREATTQDRERIAEICGESDFNSASVQEQVDRLRPRAKTLVAQHLSTIRRVADALCNETPQARRPHQSLYMDRTLAGERLERLLAEPTSYLPNASTTASSEAKS